MSWRPLKSPGKEDEAYIRQVWENIESIVPTKRLRRIEAVARGRIQDALDDRAGEAIFYWSGGKDSLALEALMREWPEIKGYFFREGSDFVFTPMWDWYDNNVPDRVHIDDGGWGFDTLKAKPTLLFPLDQATYAAWDQNKWKFQNRYRKANGVTLVFTGRRLGDGNFCGTDGVKASDGYMTVNPLYDWSFEEVLAYIKHSELDLPPCYFIHDKGFTYGTAPWAKIKFPSQRAGWEWLEGVDPQAHQAARNALQINDEDDTAKPTQMTQINTHLNLVRKPLDQLRPADYNPRNMSEEAKAKLRKSLERFGVVEPIVWNERSGNVVGGHQRLTQLLDAGCKDTDVVIVDLDDREERALNATLNNQALAGTFDIEKLDAMLADIGNLDDLLERDLCDLGLEDLFGDDDAGFLDDLAGDASAAQDNRKQGDEADTDYVTFSVPLTADQNQTVMDRLRNIKADHDNGISTGEALTILCERD